MENLEVWLGVLPASDSAPERSGDTMILQGGIYNRRKGVGERLSRGGRENMGNNDRRFLRDLRNGE